MSFQTPGGPAAKRRRIETANATLRKPFKLPFVNRQQTEPGVDSTPSPSINRGSSAASFTAQTPATPVPARGGRRPTAASPLSTSPSLITASTPGLHAPTSKRPASFASKPTQNPTTTPSPFTKPKPNPQPNALNPPDNNNLLQHLHLSQTTLATTLRTTQSRLDLARQAQRIEQQAAQAARAATHDPSAPVVDAELCALAARWKATSRLAAEELFGVVRGRVEGMGGVRAWRATRRVGRGGGGYGGWGGEGGGMVGGGRGDGDEKGGDGGEGDERGGEGEDGDGGGGEGREEEEEGEEEESRESVSWVDWVLWEVQDVS